MASRTELVYSPTYVDELEEVASDETLEHIYRLEDALTTFPDMGSPLVREALTRRYGRDVRKLIVGHYLMLYRHRDGVVQMLALVPAGSVR